MPAHEGLDVSLFEQLLACPAEILIVATGVVPEHPELAHVEHLANA
jgi:hypothetical protein